MSEKPSPVVLDPDIYDALELSCEAFGGIGAHSVSDLTRKDQLCIVGHLNFGHQGNPYCWSDLTDTVAQSFGSWNEMVRRNNDTVERMTGEHGLTFTRVSWQDFAREANIIRGTAS
jgi:hypothetical protein